MVVFSDGLDRTSRYRATEVRDLAKRLNLPIHVILSIAAIPAASDATQRPVPRPELTGEPGIDELHELATSVGGTVHTLDDLATLPAVYARIKAALRAQNLAFVRTDPGTRENEWRTIEVRVEGRDLHVYAPQGYYASW